MSKEETPHLFWKKYYNADELDKDKILLPVVKVIKQAIRADKYLRKNPTEFRLANKDYCLETALKGYFDDLIDYILRAKKDE